MVDIHNHVIFGVDDGPSAIKDSMRMVLEAEKQGINTIIATPHYHEGLYHSEKADENFNELVSRINGCGVDLHLGYEVYITPSLYDTIKKKEYLLLDKSEYLLFELPYNNLPVYAGEVIYKLHLQGVTPILAHPERNKYFVKNFDAFTRFLEHGCLLQVDAASIIGVYGMEIKNFVKKLVKFNLAYFAASDAHCPGDYTEWYLTAYNTVRRWAGEEYANKIFDENPRRILNSSRKNMGIEGG